MNPLPRNSNNDDKQEKKKESVTSYIYTFSSRWRDDTSGRDEREEGRASADCSPESRRGREEGLGRGTCVRPACRRANAEAIHAPNKVRRASGERASRVFAHDDVDGGAEGCKPGAPVSDARGPCLVRKRPPRGAPGKYSIPQVVTPAYGRHGALGR